MESREKLTTVLCGVAGEYFVAPELSRRGYVASLTLRNTRGIDVLASNPDATKAVGIQVKTNQSDRREWILNKKAEADEAENLFYVFVRLNCTREPAFHVVPRATVAQFVRANHQAWLRTPAKGGRAHVDTPMRKFKDPDDRYLGLWELLNLG
jgi:hypothetical protein